MAEDSISNRFAKREKQHKLDELSKRTRSTDDVEAEEELLAKTEKVEPLKAETPPGRNSPCPCGSGKKYKKCCGKES